MEKEQIIELVNSLFIGVDERNWELVSAVFNKTVLLDYSSMSGGEPVVLTSAQIIDSWKGILPGFDKTHHQLGNYLVKQNPEKASVFCYGTATHYLANESNRNIWTVVGTYNLELAPVGAEWKITALKFNLKYIDGNSDLVKMAQERIVK